MADEIDLPGKGKDYKQKLIYRWSMRGQLARRVRGMRRRAHKKYMTCGLIFGLLLGMGIAALLWWLIR